MKKLLTIAFIAASTASFAQGVFGPKVGLNVSSLKNNNTNTGASSDDYSSMITPSAGVVFNAQIGEYFAIRPEILWVQRGAKLAVPGGTAKLTLNYIEVPFNLVGRIPAGPGKVEIFTGASAGYMLGGKYSTPTTSGKTKGADEPTKRETGDDAAYYNYLNVSLNFGVGYNWKGLIFQAGYNLGLSNLTAHPEVNDNQTLVDYRKKNVTKASAVTFGVVYLFGNKEE